LFQIRDWLSLEEEMLKQKAVIVGDVTDILQTIDKQKVRVNMAVFYFSLKSSCRGDGKMNEGFPGGAGRGIRSEVAGEAAVL